jgi:hypothetical protein
VERIHANWPRFLERRAEIRAQQGSGGEAEVLEELFTTVLDWPPCDVHLWDGEDGLHLSRSGAKALMVAIRRPGALIWYRRQVHAALQQVRQRAGEEGVASIAASDGIMLYAADVSPTSIEEDGLRDRAFVYLGSSEPQLELRWLSVQGLSRSPWEDQAEAARLLPEMVSTAAPRPRRDRASHPRYGLPARCFAYAPYPENPDTWKLPYLLADGSVDTKRLPKAIQSLVSNYRGETVKGIPASEVPDVLVKLARAAASLGKLPHQSRKPARTYQRLAEVLAELGRLSEVVDSSS